MFASCWGRLSPLEGVKWSWDQQLVSVAATSSSIQPSSLFSSKRYGIIESPLFSKFPSSVDPMTLFHFMHIKGMISEGWDGEGSGRGGSGLGTHVHPWWIHVDVWQNQYNIVK